jgi:hypothetical protein
MGKGEILEISGIRFRYVAFPERNRGDGDYCDYCGCDYCIAIFCCQACA